MLVSSTYTRPQYRFSSVSVLFCCSWWFYKINIPPKVHKSTLSQNVTRFFLLMCVAYIRLAFITFHYIIKDVCSRFISGVSIPNRGCLCPIRGHFYSKIFNQSWPWFGIEKRKIVLRFNLPEAKNSQRGTRDVQESLCRLNRQIVKSPRPLLVQHMERLMASIWCVILMCIP